MPADCQLTTESDGCATERCDYVIFYVGNFCHVPPGTFRTGSDLAAARARLDAKAHKQQTRSTFVRQSSKALRLVHLVQTDSK